MNWRITSYRIAKSLPYFIIPFVSNPLFQNVKSRWLCLYIKAICCFFQLFPVNPSFLLKISRSCCAEMCPVGKNPRHVGSEICLVKIFVHLVSLFHCLVSLAGFLVNYSHLLVRFCTRLVELDDQKMQLDDPKKQLGNEKQ